MSLTPLITAIGNLQQITGAVDVGSVSFELVNFGDTIPRVPGTSLLVKVISTAIADVSGNFSIVLWGNDVVSPGNTYYVVTFFNDAGGALVSLSYQFLGSGTFDLSQQPTFISTSGDVAVITADGVVKHPTALQSILTYPLQVVQLNINNSQITSSATTGRAVNLPDAASTTAQAISVVSHQFLTGMTSQGVFSQAQPAFSDISGSVAASQLPNPSATTLGGIESIAAQSHKWINAISTSGVPTLTQPDYSDLTGTPTLPANTTATSHQFFTAYNSTTGAFTKAQPDYADLTSAPALPVNTTSTASQFFTAYNSTTGVFTKAQPAFTDISGTASTAQIPSLAASKITSGTLALAQGGTGVDLSLTGGTTQVLAQDASHVISARALVAADIPNLDATKLTTGQLALARGGTNADLSATGGASQVLKQVSSGAAVTVGQLAFTDISGTATAAQYVTMVGDAGSGGTKGAVPAPGAGDAAASKFLKADATWAVPAGGSAQSTSLQFGMVAVPLINPTYPKAYGINMASGDVDLYTVPANRNALVLDVTFTNPTGSGSSITCKAEAKVSGTYHTFDFICASAAQGTYGSTNSLAAFLLKAGESFAVNNSASGLSAWAYIVEFDTTTNISDARLFTLSVGDNTVFTVPANKSVSFVGLNVVAGNNIGRAWYWNNSGGSRTIQVNVVPSAGSPSVNNAIFKGTVINQQMAQALIYGGINPGDFINVNTDAATATQTAWVVYTQQ